MAASRDRIEELIAAALAGELTESEAEELERFRRVYPWIEEELAALGSVTERLRHGDLAWTTPRDTDALRRRILDAQHAEAAPARTNGDVVTGVAGPRRPRRWITPVISAACLVLGVVLGLGVPGLVTRPASGPPGTLGAVEHVQVLDDVPGIDVSADVVAHTWGTEALLEVTGLDVGATYAVVFVGDDGVEYSAGEMLGSEVPVVCRMNAAVMRDDTVRLEVRDATETVVAHAELPVI